MFLEPLVKVVHGPLNPSGDQGRPLCSLCQTLKRGCLGAKVFTKSSELMFSTQWFSVERNVLVSWHRPQVVCVCHILLLRNTIVLQIEAQTRTCSLCSLSWIPYERPIPLKAQEVVAIRDEASVINWVWEKSKVIPGFFVKLQQVQEEVRNLSFLGSQGPESQCIFPCWKEVTGFILYSAILGNSRADTEGEKKHTTESLGCF